ncbi:protein of unknown function [Burkholderia multivorans]
MRGRQAMHCRRPKAVRLLILTHDFIPETHHPGASPLRAAARRSLADGLNVAACQAATRRTHRPGIYPDT